MLLSVIFLCAFLTAAVVHLEKVNTRYDWLDQDALMWYARALADSHYSHTGDRARMPLYPLIISLFYRPEYSTCASFFDDFFYLAKYVNLALSTLLLVGLFFVFRIHFDSVQSLALTSVTGLTVFLYKAPYVHYGTLFYFLSFAAFLCMFAMLHSPRIWIGALCGTLNGLAYLTHASQLQALGAFVLFFVARECAMSVASVRSSGASLLLRRGIFMRWLSLVAVLVIFVAMVYPYWETSKKLYGRYLYNVNTTFYLWYDSWDQAKLGARGNHDRDGWPLMEPDLIPTPLKYWSDHSIGDLVRKMVVGAGIVIGKSALSHGWFKYMALMLLLAYLGYRRAGPSLEWEKLNPWQLGFAACAFLTAFAAYSWYAIVNCGARFTLGQFLPVVFTSAMVINETLGKEHVVVLGKALPFPMFVAYALLLMACVELVDMTPARTWQLPFGE